MTHECSWRCRTLGFLLLWTTRWLYRGPYPVRAFAFWALPYVGCWGYRDILEP